jgi:hypothetical protein
MTSTSMEILRHDWARLRIREGTAAQIPDTLVALANATTEAEAERAYWRIDNDVVVQGALYEAAVATAACAVALLLRCTTPGATWMLELLFQLGNGETAPSEQGNAAGDLRKLCVDELLLGAAIYFNFLDQGTPDQRFHSVDLLGLCALEDRSLLPRVQWTLSKLIDDGVEDRLEKLAREWLKTLRRGE